ncbi:MAG TPA: hypothetical protein VMU43_04150 [Candidatus Acidoferrum sp.]|nr:hypothetical protein [Candidatus Acidoferrum sp.]
MLGCVPDHYVVKLVSEALLRARAFFGWVLGQSRAQASTNVILAAQRCLPAATWQQDKACILAGTRLSVLCDMPATNLGEVPSGEFPYWVALDKHTPKGKTVLQEVAKEMNVS